MNDIRVPSITWANRSPRNGGTMMSIHISLHSPAGANSVRHGTASATGGGWLGLSRVKRGNNRGAVFDDAERYRLFLRSPWLS